MTYKWLNQVNNREQDDPNEIDEVPIQPDDLDATVIGLRVLPAERFQRHVDHADHAHRDVEAVEARHRVERRAVEPFTRHEAFLDEMRVFVNLNADEARADDACRDEPEAKLPEQSVLHGGERFYHRHAA